MLSPGFTGSSLDRADALRNDPDALANARADWRARLLRLDGIDPGGPLLEYRSVRAAA